MSLASPQLRPPGQSKDTLLSPKTGWSYPAHSAGQALGSLPCPDVERGGAREHAAAGVTVRPVPPGPPSWTDTLGDLSDSIVGKEGIPKPPG